MTRFNGVMKAEDVERANAPSVDLSNYKLVLPGDIAYNSMRMWQGASGVSAHRGIVSPAYTVVVPCEGQLPSFWGYYFKLPATIGVFERYSQGLTSDTWNLKFSAFSLISLPVPHPDEQAKIAAALAALDRRLDLAACEEAALRRFKAGLLQAMFA